MILALAITGVTLVAFFAIWMIILFISLAIADSGYVGKHRAAKRRNQPAKRKRAPSAPRSYHRTLGGRGARTTGLRATSRGASTRGRERRPARQAPTSA